jgi:hypothetical protein
LLSSLLLLLPSSLSGLLFRGCVRASELLWLVGRGSCLLVSN